MEDRPHPTASSDEALIASARRGNGDAFAALVARHQEVAFRTAYVVLGDADLAADAAQEAFISVYRSIHRFRAGEPFRPWLLTIVGNRARNLRRGAGRRQAATFRMASLRGDRAVEGPESAVLRDEQRQRVLDAVNALPPADRAIVAARHFLDLSEAEASAALRLPLGTVKSRLFRARRRLLAALDETAESRADG